MMRSLALTALVALCLSACSREQPAAPEQAQPQEQAKTDAAPPPAAAPEATPPVASAQEPATAAEKPAATPSPETQQATAAQESAGEATEEDKHDASLNRLTTVPKNQALPDDRWKAGKNYRPLVPPQPTNTSAGQVEVIEVFAYGCPHCAELEPYIASWLKTKPAYIKFEQIPAWGAEEAKLYYTIEALGRSDLHPKVFKAIHPAPGERHYDLLFVQGDDAESTKLQRKFLMANGVSGEDFDKARNSFSLATNLKRADALLRRYNEIYEVGTVPSIVINGKYLTDVGSAGGHPQLLQLINDLAASEKPR